MMQCGAAGKEKLLYPSFISYPQSAIVIVIVTEGAVKASGKGGVTLPLDRVLVMEVWSSQREGDRGSLI